jgi:hypothetical protein
MVDERFRQGDLASGARGIDPTVLDQIDLLSVVSHELGHIASHRGHRPRFVVRVNNGAKGTTM